MEKNKVWIASTNSPDWYERLSGILFQHVFFIGPVVGTERYKAYTRCRSYGAIHPVLYDVTLLPTDQA